MSDSPDVDTADYSDERMIQDCLEIVVKSHLPDAVVTGWVLQLAYVQPEDLERDATGYQEYAAPHQSYHSALGLATQLKRSIEAWGSQGGQCTCE